VPAGTPRIKAEAYRKLPRGRGDRGPLGGIGPEGLHVDSLTLGTRYRNGCEGDSEHFTARRGHRINACIRVVHRRIPQQLLVRWERDGKLVWRQWLPVPAVHAYRSRASIPAKKRYRGTWTIRVESLDGVELARQSFTVK
jgi:hypothetical protein